MIKPEEGLNLQHNYQGIVMDLIVTVRSFVFFLLCVSCVTGLDHGLIYAVANQELTKNNKVSKHLQSNSDLQNIVVSTDLRTSQANVIKRSLNEDMQRLSEIILPELVDENRNVDADRSSSNLRNKNHKRNNLYSENSDKKLSSLIKLQTHGLTTLKQNSKRISNNSTVSTINNLPHRRNHHKHLHSIISDNGRLKSHPNCASTRRRLRVLLRLFKNWNFSSCKFARSESNLPNSTSGCVAPCSASSMPCCLLNVMDRRRGRRTTKRSAGTQKPREKVKQTHPNRYPFESASVGDTVSIPRGSVEQGAQTEEQIDGFIIKDTGRAIRISPRGRRGRGQVRGVLPEDIDEYCAIKTSLHHVDGMWITKLQGEKSRLYLAMNNKFRLYATDNAKDPNVQFIHDYVAATHDAFKSRLHQSYIAFSRNGKPRRRNTTLYSSTSLYHLLKVNLENLKADIKALLRQSPDPKSNLTMSIKRRKPKTTTTSLAAAVTTPTYTVTSSTTSTLIEKSTTESSVISGVTRGNKIGRKRGRKPKTHKKRKEKRKKGRKKKGKKSKQCKSSCKKRNKKKNKNRSRRSVVVFNDVVKSRRQNNLEQQIELNASGSFLLKSLLQLEEKYLSNLWSPT